MCISFQYPTKYARLAENNYCTPYVFEPEVHHMYRTGELDEIFAVKARTMKCGCNQQAHFHEAEVLRNHMK